MIINYECVFVRIWFGKLLACHWSSTARCPLPPRPTEGRTLRAFCKQTMGLDQLSPSFASPTNCRSKQCPTKSFVRKTIHLIITDILPMVNKNQMCRNAMNARRQPKFQMTNLNKFNTEFFFNGYNSVKNHRTLTKSELVLQFQVKYMYMEF